MRILAVGNMYPPHHAGGYETMWQAVMRHLREEGHRVRVLTSRYRIDDRPEDDPDVHRTLRWYWDLERYAFPQLGPLQRAALERHNAAELDGHLRDLAPDVVTWWSMGCMSLSLVERVRRAGIPAALVVHDDWLVYGPQHDQWMRMWRGARLAIAPLAQRLVGIPTTVDLAGAGRFVFNSRFVLERALAAGISAPHMAVVHPGIDGRFLVDTPPRPWSWRLTCVGRIDRQKGIDVAVRALAELPEAAILDIWGTGDDSYVAEMTALAADLGVAERVRFRGGAGADQLHAVYDEADAVVFPVRWEEPFGLVPLEAMGVGRPVVTTVRGGSAEFIRDEENALAFAVDDASGLAHQLLRLAEDPQLRERLRAGGRATARRFTIERFAEQTAREVIAAAPAVSERR